MPIHDLHHADNIHVPRDTETKDLDIKNLEQTQLPIPDGAEENTDLQGPCGSDGIIHICCGINLSEFQDSLGCFRAPAPKREPDQSAQDWKSRVKRPQQLLLKCEEVETRT
jgi:hypothetical protein